MLEVDAITTRYGAITALHAVSLHVDAGEIVALVGPNGAGKTTLLNTVAGLLKPAHGRVRIDGMDVTGRDPAAAVRAGVALVPERRRIFRDLTVGENLEIGGVATSKAARLERLERVRTTFPVLDVMWSISGGYLSGGEAQQLAIARALMSDPRLLLLDEPTLGLAPMLVGMVFDLIQSLREEGRTILVVEQNARRALQLADRGYVLRTGRVAAHGPGPELAQDADLFATFVGVGE